MNKRRKCTANFLLTESKPCVPCRMSISLKGWGAEKGVASGDVFC
jgi:hypothetical protein